MAGLSVDDQLAIQQLYARYNHAIDSGQAAAWAACFTPEGTFSSASGNFAGRAELEAFATAFAQRLKARHWTSNLVVEGDGAGARGTCYLMLLRINAEGPASILTTGVYDDRLINIGDGWRFTSRKVAGDA